MIDTFFSTEDLPMKQIKIGQDHSQTDADSGASGADKPAEMTTDANTSASQS